MEVWAPEVAARGARKRDVPSFRAYADVWLETRKTKGRELQPTTRRQYRMLPDKFILPTFGDEPIDRISNEAVNAWYDPLAPGRETIRAQSYSLCSPSSPARPRSGRTRGSWGPAVRR